MTVALVPPCCWPGCGRPGDISADGCATGWCWDHVDTGPPDVVQLARAVTCRKCGIGTTQGAGGEEVHPRCWRSWAMARAAAALT